MRHRQVSRDSPLSDSFTLPASDFMNLKTENKKQRSGSNRTEAEQGGGFLDAGQGLHRGRF